MLGGGSRVRNTQPASHERDGRRDDLMEVITGRVDRSDGGEDDEVASCGVSALLEGLKMCSESSSDFRRVGSGKRMEMSNQLLCCRE